MEMKEKQELYDKILKFAWKEYQLGQMQEASDSARDDLKDYLEKIFETYRKEDPEQ